MSKNILITITDGVEDMEFIVVYDMLKREGYKIDVAFMNGKEYLKSSKDIVFFNKVNKSEYLEDINKYDVLYIPGGPGTPDLDKVKEMDFIINHFFKNDKVVGAICAAPMLLAKRGFLKGKKVMSHSSVWKIVEDYGGIIVTKSKEWNDPNANYVLKKLVTGYNHLSTQDFAFKFIDTINKY